jgi:putative tryptophan/tyrosine transport system substrate-binding protein
VNKNIIRVVLVAVLFTLTFEAAAQQPKRVPRIGFLGGASISESQGIEPFRQGLRELGYIDGQNIVVDIRAMEGKTHRIPDLIAELNRSKVDMMVTPVGSSQPHWVMK